MLLLTTNDEKCFSFLFILGNTIKQNIVKIGEKSKTQKMKKHAMKKNELENKRNVDKRKCEQLQEKNDENGHP